MSIKQSLIEFICQNFMVEEHEIDMNESLVDQGIIDSFGLVEISGFLKRKFGIETEPADMNRNNFGSVEKIVIYVNSKQM